ncbi:MAG TPA: DUF5602 domain-containing protein [Longimicrobiales bacterium]|nr:DUF5602 domain-containing protein [Longimicrobiales bacterium]
MHHTTPHPRWSVPRGVLALVALLSAGLVLAACDEGSTAPGDRHELLGEAVTVGNGVARTFAVDSGGRIASVGIELTEGALAGLPSTMTEWMLPLPAGVQAAPWDHATLDWNPQGHEPAAIYGLPHFDFHVYAISAGEQAAIQGGPDTTTVPAANVPKDYASQVISVPRMGVHWADTLAAEFHGHPFDRTFIYGFYHGRLAFVEPMVTQAFLRSHPDVTAPVKQPGAFQVPGLYPASYSVRYDPGTRTLRVSLDSLVAR